jgi:hypothetical protein
MADFDAVITWVDGADAAHARKRQEYMAREGRSRRTNATFETRFVQQGEIYYCIASILKYAPFVRRIHVVTDAQRPALIDEFARSGLCDPGRIEIVDHRVLFKGHEQALPTFNSRTIEAMLGRIPGIAEYFLDFNDDFFLNAPLRQEQFVDADGRVRLNGRLREVGPRLWTWRWKRLRAWLQRDRHPEPSFQLAQMLSARMLGLPQFLRTPHMPYLFRRDTLLDYFAAHPSVLERQLAHRFRDLSQFMPAALSNHLEMQAGRAIVEDVPCCAYIEPGAAAADEAAAVEAIGEESLPFGCIQSLDRYPPERQRFFHALLARKFDRFLPAAAQRS